MTIENSASPAADAHDFTSSPAADDVAPLGALTMDSAASLLTEMDELKATENPAQDAGDIIPAEPQENAEPAENAVSEDKDGGDDQNAEPSTDGEDQTPTDEENDAQDPAEKVVDFESLKGDTKLRLRDRSEVTVAELKRDIDDLRNVRQIQHQLGQHVQQFNNAKAEFNNRVANSQQTYDLALEVLKQRVPDIPEMPPIELMSTDHFQYMEKKDARERAIQERQDMASKFEAIQKEKQRQHDEAVQAQRAQAAQLKNWHNHQLAQKQPDFVKKPGLWSEVCNYIVGEGAITADELRSVDHHGVYLLAEKAMKYDKLMAEKPRPVKETVRKEQPVNPAPGAAGKRQTKEDVEASKRQEVQQRIRARGDLSIEDAANFMTELDV